MDAAWKYEKQFKKGDPRIFCVYQPRNEPPTIEWQSFYFKDKPLQILNIQK